MGNLNSVSETALFTLMARVCEAEKQDPIIFDTQGIEILTKLKFLVSSDFSKKLLEKKLPPTLTNYLALRARKFDLYTKAFIKRKGGLVVSLGSGFDTRYWRIADPKLNYLEIDLPEVIQIKKVLFEEEPPYEMIGRSVLDDQWIEMISSRQTENILFLAEGLLMYLNEIDAIDLFKRLSEVFSNSEMVFEVINKKYTQGMWKKVVMSKMKRRFGTEAGASYNYGISYAKEIESYASNIRVLEEWSHFEEPDIVPRFQRYLRKFKLFSRTQWTIRARIE